ncbi:hypothetical protein QIS99_02240 [Streptomyces sp. B-S-A8]|uniref:PAAR domain-containing protein n=1 Tax=Streptomyces solicavernae TaxID=3043614 RepID=A0ABT6RKT3_9ACTN|nr:hypothetical protein [Streptomyces sp. B-S-A8]MDI3385040.1 hypothetical protein [Streptomyces sp. B-S-A8]
MSGNLLGAGALVSCPHGGRATAAAGGAAVHIGGVPVATAAHTFTVTGCPHTVDGVPTPCVTVRWAAGETGVTVGGAPVLLDTSAAQCFTAASVPQGPPVVHSAQREVSVR